MRVRRGLFGTGERPRLAVYRSSKQIYAQAIDDQTGQTLASASSLDKEFKENLSGTKTDVAKSVGEQIANRLTAKGVTSVIFDRRWYRFHGRVKALADSAREHGLQF